MLSTPEWTAKAIAGAITHTEVQKILQDGTNTTMFIDGTHIRIRRPSDEAQKDHHSGKKKFHSKNVLIITTRNGIVVGISRPFEGKTHDMRVLKEDFPDLGRWLESMKEPNTPKSERILVYSDTGYVGIENAFHGRVRAASKNPKTASSPRGEPSDKQQPGDC